MLGIFEYLDLETGPVTLIDSVDPKEVGVCEHFLDCLGLPMVNFDQHWSDFTFAMLTALLIDACL